MYSDNLNFVEIETAEGLCAVVGGSYNDVPFFVEECNSAGGRNISTKSIPFSADHINEDLGQRLRELQLTFYLVGENIEAMRERLEEAFNTEGIGDLKHPYYGVIECRCAGYTINYSKSEQQYLSGTVTFIPENRIDASAVEVDYQGVVEEKASSFIDELKGKFSKLLDLAGKASSIVDAAVDAVNTCLDAVESARNMMRAVSSFVSNISQIRDNIETLLDTPAELAVRLNALLEQSNDVVGGNDFETQAKEMFQVMRNTEVDSGSMISENMRGTIQEFVLMSAAASAAKCAVYAEYTSSEQVSEMQQNIRLAFENSMEKAVTVDDYMNLADLLGSVLKYLSDTASKVAAVVDLPLRASRDILTACFDCYGSLDRLDEVIARNAVADPMVITRNSLKVLSK